MTQLDLLTYPNAPGFKQAGTSKAAAESMKPSAATLRAEVYEFMRGLSDGLTADECAEYMGGASVLSIRPRFSELRAMGLIVDTGWRRLNKSGRRAVVWKAA